jgi:hypothetical protein
VVRTGLVTGEPLTLTAVLLGTQPAKATLSWRKMGAQEASYAEIPLVHRARGIYTVSLPPEATKADLEYFILVTATTGQTFRFPPTAPDLNQTVVVSKE